MTAEQKRIWMEWRRMHFHSQTLIAQLEKEEERQWGGMLGTRIRVELDELNTQLAELEDENEWLPELIANES